MMTGDALKFTPATGYLADNWLSLSTLAGRPAVVLNPDATDLDCLAWLWGEVRALLTTTQALARGNEIVDAVDIEHIYQHRLEPMATVIEAVVTRGQAATQGEDSRATNDRGTA